MRPLLLALVLTLAGCGETIEGKKDGEIRKTCRKIGTASDGARFTLIGYLCPDGLEYWIPRSAK